MLRLIEGLYIFKKIILILNIPKKKLSDDPSELQKIVKKKKKKMILKAGVNISLFNSDKNSFKYCTRSRTTIYLFDFGAS